MRKSLARQIFIYFVIVIVLPLGTVSLFSYYQSSSALDEQAEKLVSQIIATSLSQTDNYLRRYERASNSILSNNEIKSFLDMNPEDSYGFFEFRNDIQKEVFGPTFILYNEINVIYILGEHGRMIIDDNQSPALLRDFNTKEKLEHFKRTLPENGEIAILKESLRDSAAEGVFTIARWIRGRTSYEPKGVLAMEIKAEELAQIWKDADLGISGTFFILDSNGVLIYRPPGLQSNGQLNPELTAKLLESDVTTLVDTMNNEPHLFVSRESAYSGWRVVVSLPLREMRQPIATLRTTTIAVGLITLMLALVLAARFGRSIVKPILTLKEGMRETQKGNWQHITTDSQREDEIGGLLHSYNTMVTRLSEMIAKVYESELEKQKVALELRNIVIERQKAEFQALQLQINPHFLYNTLQTINAYAIVQNSDEITEMVEAMAFMLRYSIQTNLEEITVANELNHVLNYMTILKHRIAHEFELDVIVPPSLLLEKMVRLTLQPLIENVFQHAFPRGLEERHYIRIDALEDNGLFLFVVEDNGVGMTPEGLEQLRDKLSRNRLAEPTDGVPSRGGGIGLMNVHRRIQMVFGEQYGLFVDSEEGLGTKITMCMPKTDRKSNIYNREGEN
ncbi:cache domain-containing sensor histidine kinase [Paenibacillus agricola]|nr:sensor histidine kinase [Paenibacillus agricola]